MPGDTGLTLAEESYLVSGGNLQRLLAALLIELAELGHLEAQGEKTVLTDREPPEELLLARALKALRRGRPAQTAAARLGALQRQFPWDEFPKRLMSRGVLQRSLARDIWGDAVYRKYDSRRYTEVGGPGHELREAVRRAVLGEAEPDARTATHVSLLALSGGVPILLRNRFRRAPGADEAVLRAGKIAERTSLAGLPGTELQRQLFEARNPGPGFSAGSDWANSIFNPMSPTNRTQAAAGSGGESLLDGLFDGLFD